MCHHDVVIGVLFILWILTGCGRQEPPPQVPAVASGGAAHTEPTHAPAAHASNAGPPSTPAQDPSRVRAVVKLVVLGRFPRSLADAAEAGLRETLQVDVVRMARLGLPRAAYYPPRRRYRAERLLAFLNRQLEGEPATTRVLGLTSVDISTTNGRYPDWGVFGLGELGGRSCVISTYRLRRRARSAAHAEFRIVTTAIHEVGHTLGLGHCTEPQCIMRDAEGSIRTVDTSNGRLGPECRAELDRDSPRALPLR